MGTPKLKKLKATRVPDFRQHLVTSKI